MTSIPRRNLTEKIHVTLRLDDYSARSNTAFEDALIEIAQRNQFSILFGVIPFVCDGYVRDISQQHEIPLDYKKAQILKEAIASNAIEVALHGYRHQTVTPKGRGKPTEFSGVDSAIQHTLIERGKAYLEDQLGLPIQIFVPPWNSYDANTLLALEALEFDCLASGTNFGTVRQGERLRYIPATCTLSELDHALENVRRDGRSHVISIMMHEYDFVEVNQKRGIISIPEFEARMVELIRQPDVQLTTYEHILQTDNVDATRYWSNAQAWIHRSLMPFPIANYFSGVYWEQTAAWRNLFLTQLVMGGYYVFLLFVAGLSVFYLDQQTHLSQTIGLFAFRSAFLLLFAAMSLLIFLRGGLKNYRRASVVALTAGLVVGVFA